MDTSPQLRVDTADVCSSYTSPLDNWLRYQAQSILVGVVHQPEPPPIEQARDILAWAAKARTYE